MNVKPATAPATTRRQVLLLTGLLVVLGALVLFQVLPMLGSGGTAAPAGDPAAPVAASPAGRAASGPVGTRPASAGKSGPVEEVALAKLERQWPEPTSSRRNPFTMTAEPPPPALAPPPKLADPVPAQPVGPPPPPPVPPITLKFLGTISGPNRVGKIAALSDGKFVYRGREGQIVEGRYRIVKIGEDSIQIEYVNGTGRQTIRLSGK